MPFKQCNHGNITERFGVFKFILFKTFFVPQVKLLAEVSYFILCMVHRTETDDTAT